MKNYTFFEKAKEEATNPVKKVRVKVNLVAYNKRVK